jgi:hypothetical protein
MLKISMVRQLHPKLDQVGALGTTVLIFKLTSSEASHGSHRGCPQVGCGVGGGSRWLWLAAKHSEAGVTCGPERPLLNLHQIAYLGWRSPLDDSFLGWNRPSIMAWSRENLKIGWPK